MARGLSRRVQAAWQRRLKLARSLYSEKVAIRKQMLAERGDQVWPINLGPDPDGRFALHLALQEESAARTEYMRILKIFNDLMREGTLPDEEPGLFVVGPETDWKLYRLSAMDDEEDQETPFQAMDAQQLVAKTAWVRLFVREASERGFTIEEIAALLHEPGMTAKEALERILCDRNPK